MPGVSRGDGLAYAFSLPGLPMSGISNIPHPRNEPVLSYAPGTPERAALKDALAAVGAQQIEIPAVVAGREVR
jgi:1-pyrroline-5-carboxylate dehydrogenase